MPVNRSYYNPSDLKVIPELAKLAPQAAASYFYFEKQIYEGSDILPPKTKELIAVAVAHVVGCPYCIDVHVKKCKEQGGTKEEIFEAVLVAASTRAGAVLSHATQALLAYDRTAEELAASTDQEPRGHTPECFC